MTFLQLRELRERIMELQQNELQNDLVPTPKIVAPSNLINDLLAVREALSIEGNGFNMWVWSGPSECGTVCCIAGHLACLHGYTPVPYKLATAGSLFQKDNDKPFSITSILGWTNYYEKGIESIYGDFFKNNLEVLWLFGLDNWPVELKFLYISNPVKAGQAAIDRFIEMYGSSTKVIEDVVTELTTK